MSETILSHTVGPVRELLVIAPHHPDHLCRPAPRPEAVENERFRQTILWNVFRTLELLPPAFWLRRLQARLLALLSRQGRERGRTTADHIN